TCWYNGELGSSSSRGGKAIGPCGISDSARLDGEGDPRERSASGAFSPSPGGGLPAAVADRVDWVDWVGWGDWVDVVEQDGEAGRIGSDLWTPMDSLCGKPHGVDYAPCTPLRERLRSYFAHDGVRPVHIRVDRRPVRRPIQPTLHSPATESWDVL